MTVRDMTVEACKEALPALTASLVGGLVAGIVPGGMRVGLRAAPGLLILIPTLLATRGNVYGSFDARIATALHRGLIEPHVTGDDERPRATATAALANDMLTNTFTVVTACFLLTLLGSQVVPFPILVDVAIVTGLLSGIVLTVVIVSVIFAGYRRRHNPDTIIGPVVTTTGDVFSVLFLFIAVRTVPTITGIFWVSTEWTVRAITRTILPVLLMLTLVELGNGLVLRSFEAQLFRYPSLSVLTPVTVGTAGDLGSVPMTQLSTSFHLGAFSFSPRGDKFVGSTVAALALIMTVFPITGVGAWVATLLVSGDTSLTLQKIVLVALSSRVSLAVLAAVVTLSATYLTYRFGLDPDDAVIPVVTNLCDVLGVIVLFGVTQVLV